MMKLKNIFQLSTLVAAGLVTAACTQAPSQVAISEVSAQGQTTTTLETAPAPTADNSYSTPEYPATPRTSSPTFDLPSAEAAPAGTLLPKFGDISKYENAAGGRTAAAELDAAYNAGVKSANGTSVQLANSTVLNGYACPTNASYQVNVARDENNKPIYAQIKKGSYKGATYTLQKGDTFFLVGYLVGKKDVEIANLNGLQVNSPLSPGMVLLVNPEHCAPEGQVRAAATAPAVPTKSPAQIEAEQRAQAEQLRAQAQAQARLEAAKAAEERARAEAEARLNAQRAQADQAAAEARAQAQARLQEQQAQAEAARAQAQEQADRLRREAQAQAQQSSSPAPTVAGNGQASGPNAFRWPADGRLIGTYSKAPGQSKGIRIAGSSGQTIVAADAGTVAYVGKMDGLGQIVLVRNPTTNIITVYGNLQRPNVSVRQKISKGTPIGSMGSVNGTAQVYFEVRRGGDPIDPLSVLPKR